MSVEDELRKENQTLKAQLQISTGIATVMQRERNLILRTLMELADTAETVDVNVMAKSLDIINKFSYRLQEEEGKYQKQAEHITLSELVEIVQEHDAGHVCITGLGQGREADLQWVVMAAVGQTAVALYTWGKFEPGEEVAVERAKQAYFAYGQSVGFKNYQGNPMPEWDALPEKIREAWVAASHEVYTLRIREGTLEK